MFDNELENIFYSYALDDNKVFERLTSGSFSFRILIAQLMSDLVASDKIREMIVAKYMGLKHNSTNKGHDAIDRFGRSWEIKTEQRNVLKYKLDGKSKWHKTTDKNLDTYRDQNILQAGFIGGKLVYIVSFSIDESGVLDRMKHGAKSVNYSYISWEKLTSLQLFYLNDKYLNEDIIIPGLIYLLEDLGEGKWI